MNAPPKTLGMRIKTLERPSPPGVPPVAAVPPEPSPGPSLPPQGEALLPRAARAAPPGPRPKAGEVTTREGPGSLPVLEAFQEFLEQERRVVRRRLHVLTVTYVLILAALVAGGLLLGMRVLRSINARVDSVRNDIAAAKTDTSRAGQEARAALDRVSAADGALRSAAAADREHARRFRSQVVNVLTNYTAEVDRLRELVAMLKQEGAALKGAVPGAGRGPASSSASRVRQSAGPARSSQPSK